MFLPTFQIVFTNCFLLLEFHKIEFIHFQQKRVFVLTIKGNFLVNNS